MLVLPIKKKWFEMIASEKKKEEYREIKPYYDIRLGKTFIGYEITEKEIELLRGNRTLKEDIIFRNGYSYDSPSIKCKCVLRIGKGKEEWGAEPKKEYYILTILKILEVKNYERSKMERKDKIR